MVAINLVGDNYDYGANSKPEANTHTTLLQTPTYITSDEFQVRIRESKRDIPDTFAQWPRVQRLLSFISRYAQKLLQSHKLRTYQLMHDFAPVLTVPIKHALIYECSRQPIKPYLTDLQLGLCLAGSSVNETDLPQMLNQPDISLPSLRIDSRNRVHMKKTRYKRLTRNESRQLPYRSSSAETPENASECHGEI